MCLPQVWLLAKRLWHPIEAQGRVTYGVLGLRLCEPCTPAAGSTVGGGLGGGGREPGCRAFLRVEGLRTCGGRCGVKRYLDYNSPDLGPRLTV